MFFAHLPAGYLFTSALSRSRRVRRGISLRVFMAAGLAGSIFPDIDLLYFFLIDQRQHHHHTYWTHLPLFWITMSAIALLFFAARKNTAALACTLVFGANIFLHLMLDTLVGDIWWLYPLVDQPFALSTVPALYSPWWLNFVLHWSMAVEAGIVLAASLHLRQPFHANFTPISPPLPNPFRQIRQAFSRRVP
ncbi:hypothetical protein SKTS_08330 [Sulfurimicrobium lacus]|uniref:Metal-dependent hydrolase n=1 Tax=Sulfurimicrobium lacus TaxID=2715678 RepID=A0A6F8VA09_9PROT|nr:metal-dependent hydrolase [Sulfurimicrobium lacus]BCB25947.1 hypothetical protein SKTS_08330 [Sulfurimicrobium lacus]